MALHYPVASSFTLETRARFTAWQKTWRTVAGRKSATIFTRASSRASISAFVRRDRFTVLVPLIWVDCHKHTP